jgi:hypothetical protein
MTRRTTSSHPVVGAALHVLVSVDSYCSVDTRKQKMALPPLKYSYPKYGADYR